MKQTKKKLEKPKQILYIWEDREGSYGHAMIDEPMKDSWKSQIEASERVWRNLVKRGVII